MHATRTVEVVGVALLSLLLGPSPAGAENRSVVIVIDDTPLTHPSLRSEAAHQLARDGYRAVPVTDPSAGRVAERVRCALVGLEQREVDGGSRVHARVSVIVEVGGSIRGMLAGSAAGLGPDDARLRERVVRAAARSAMRNVPSVLGGSR